MLSEARYGAPSAVTRDLANRRQVVGTETAADGVGQELFGERANEILAVAEEQRPQSGHALEPAAVWQ